MDVVQGPDGKPRCEWALTAPDFLEYHDTEWGFPVTDDVRLFEKLSLEAFQSGLSWRTILAKRDNFRAAFAGFDFRKLANYGESDVLRLLQDAGIIRHRGKIEAVLNNAGRVESTAGGQSLAAYVWKFEPALRQSQSERVSTTAESVAFAKALKSEGWKFIGPTTAYAFMQAMGLVNDHHPDCIIHDQVEAARKTMQPPAWEPPAR